MPRRYRCVRCRSLVDLDLNSCPFCGEHDPLGYRRTRRAYGVAFALVVLALASAWVVF